MRDKRKRTDEVPLFDDAPSEPVPVTREQFREALRVVNQFREQMGDCLSFTIRPDGAISAAIIEEF